MKHQPIRTLETLRARLQEAVAIEHAVIPPYLAAWLSIPPGVNPEAAGIVRTVLLEEMLHLTLAANVLNAVGGEPRLTAPGFIQAYPSPLPCLEDAFLVSIEKFSPSALETFLKIERPAKADPPEAGQPYKTIGQFYAGVVEGIEWLCGRLGEKRVFCGDPSRQVPPGAYYGTGKYFVVKDKKSALDALKEIVSEGEGQGGSVFDEDPNVCGRGREPAHYYRFKEIQKGRYYRESDKPERPPTGKALAVDFTQIYPCAANTRLEDYAPGSGARTALEEFSAAYGQLLAAIEDGFNGKPARMNDAIAAMFRVENLGRALMRTPSGKADGSTLGLCFAAAAQARPGASPAETAEIDRVIAAHAAAFRKPGVVSVRPGWKVTAGWPTPRRAIVATVERKRADVPDEQRIPAMVGPYPTDVREATPKHLARVRDPEQYQRMAAHERPEEREPDFPLERDAQTGRRLGTRPPAPAPSKPHVAYTPAPGVTLDAVTAKMTLTCQVSPDAGWATLKSFLSGVKQQLTVGMYDFTSAHVLDTVLAGMAKGQQMSLVLDHPTLDPTANQTDEDTAQRLMQALGQRLAFAWAATGMDPMVTAAMFPTSYHIKVAVRDRAAFWLSSGNWNNSNQPDVDPLTPPLTPAAKAIVADSDRDWHVIVEHAGLAQTLDAYLRHDLTAATPLQNHDPLADAKVIGASQAKGGGRIPQKFFAAKQFSNVTVKIQPLLTPDLGAGNYASHIAELIQSARKSVYVQTQYLHPPAAGDPKLAGFRAILDALAAKVAAKLDVRLIFSQYETAAYLEQVQSAGIPASAVKIQHGVHNKGIVVDSSVVALGSQNWSADGALFNRDASLIIYDANVAQYYEQVFLHDWEHMAEQKLAAAPAAAGAAAAG